MESTQKKEEKLKEILVNIHKKGNNSKELSVKEMIKEIKEEMISLIEIKNERI
jgi:hypothetical protein